MPFVHLEIVPNTELKKLPVATLSYMRNKNAKNNKSPQLRLTVPKSITGEASSTCHYLLVGTDDDLGKLLIVGENATGYGVAPATMVKPTSLRATLRWNFGYVPLLGDEIFDGERFKIEKIADEVLQINLPIGFITLPAQETPRTKGAPARRSR